MGSTSTSHTPTTPTTSHHHIDTPIRRIDPTRMSKVQSNTITNTHHHEEPKTSTERYYVHVIPTAEDSVESKTEPGTHIPDIKLLTITKNSINTPATTVPFLTHVYSTSHVVQITDPNKQISTNFQVIFFIFLSFYFKKVFL